ncbi:hypothetical protein [uncultured Roseobacter sp.]|uniref:hypothetical protein n=1 Tax=uncultured Roseobacter sp. TaxID=114847 RepID=UPI0026397960|nr:hypothetical protein [uncultured Roseobacter sp.]
MLIPSPKLSGLFPQDILIIQSVAAAHLLFGQYDKAMVLLKLAQWLEPECPKTLELAAYCAFCAGNSKAGISAVEKLEKQSALVSKELRVRRRVAAQFI